MSEEEINLLKKFNPGDEYTEKVKQAIENLLAEREEDKKKITELEEHQEKFYKGELYTAKQLKQIEENQKKYFINKQKIKDKIEELKKKDMTIYFGKRTHSKTFQQTVREVEIKLLEELLEDK